MEQAPHALSGCLFNTGSVSRQIIALCHSLPGAHLFFRAEVPQYCLPKGVGVSDPFCTCSDNYAVAKHSTYTGTTRRPDQVVGENNLRCA
eukprot:3809751-Pleurochrysis_carterae.AAC.1